jgi:hypothetical protein
MESMSTEGKDSVIESVIDNIQDRQKLSFNLITFYIRRYYLGLKCCNPKPVTKHEIIRENAYLKIREHFNIINVVKNLHMLRTAAQLLLSSTSYNLISMNSDQVLSDTIQEKDPKVKDFDHS